MNLFFIFFLDVKNKKEVKAKEKDNTFIKQILPLFIIFLYLFHLSNYISNRSMYSYPIFFPLKLTR